jgi:hypothetical protein
MHILSIRYHPPHALNQVKYIEDMNCVVAASLDKTVSMTDAGRRMVEGKNRWWGLVGYRVSYQLAKPLSSRSFLPFPLLLSSRSCSGGRRGLGESNHNREVSAIVCGRVVCGGMLIMVVFWTTAGVAVSHRGCQLFTCLAS